MFYSVRMRASCQGAHISGGEKLVGFQDIHDTLSFFAEKAYAHPKGRPDCVHMQVEHVESPITYIAPLPVHTYEADSVSQAFSLACSLLASAGITRADVEKAVQLFQQQPMRGALLFDLISKKAVWPTDQTSIRVSRMDWVKGHFEQWAADHHFPPSHRVKEALALATKVVSHPVIAAELCWSDDPGYTTGYVAHSDIGYCRITNLKQAHDQAGCRIFFLRHTENIERLRSFLKTAPVFISTKRSDLS